MQILTCVRPDRKVSLEMAQWCAERVREGCGLDVCPGNHVDAQRNYLVECHRGEWILFVDSDVRPPDEAIAELLTVRQPVVAGLCPIEVNGHACWNAGPVPAYLDRQSVLPEGPFQVDRAGTACMLISPVVFEKLLWPWFKTEIRHAKPGDGELLVRSDDEYFCDACKAAGIPVYAHPGVICRHPI
jgi:hypothetical protein